MNSTFQNQYERLLEAHGDLRLEMAELLRQLDYLSSENDRLRSLHQGQVAAKLRNAASRDEEIEALNREILRLTFMLRQPQEVGK